MEATQQNENKLNVDHQTKQNTIPNMRACVCGLYCIYNNHQVCCACMSINLATYLSIYLSVCSCVCLYVCSCVCLFVCLSGRVSVCSCVCLFVCLSVRVSVCSCVCLFVCMSVYLYICLSVCQYVCLSVCIFVFLYVCPSVSLYVCMKFLILLKPVFHYVLMCSCPCVLVHLSNLVSNLPLVLYPVTYIAVHHCTFIFVVLQES